jgi:hypothetical protein
MSNSQEDFGFVYQERSGISSRGSRTRDQHNQDRIHDSQPESKRQNPRSYPRRYSTQACQQLQIPRIQHGFIIVRLVDSKRPSLVSFLGTQSDLECQEHQSSAQNQHLQSSRTINSPIRLRSLDFDLRNGAHGR